VPVLWFRYTPKKHSELLNHRQKRKYYVARQILEFWLIWSWR